ncbi:MAG: ShlB/FhaC/HecB family hemolysin secretion/activation protein [Pigmentiphaga sp.]|uniref:ShlB/FhaC/HecB family hemolysin secretion/activation protein n=1 Tax=Pigmentiphaga sp. TaxID=1977564 RepID=UPI0029A964D0|nr:ShlB/FhaC/HecB family hemolysin secretion/activation protein [Pigmentiphaga sp.]MDX3907731.1 ShlB/FhaC/HecB family hemolysin secretion/activation protein [Pigmentiphaga sp.]
MILHASGKPQFRQQYLAVLLTWLATPWMAQAADSPLRGNPAESLPPVSVPTPKPAPSVSVPAPAPADAVRGILSHRLVPRQFDVSGVTAIDFQKVIDLLEPLAGKDVTVADLIQRTNAITQLYRDAGYALSFALIQSQDFRDGLVKVTVVEGYVESTRIEGDAGAAADKVREYAARIEAERPLTRATLERYLNLMTTVAGATIKPELSMPKRADGGTELVLNVEHKRFRLDSGIGNLGTGVHGMLTATANGLTPLAEQVQVTAAVPRGGDDLEYYAANVAVPVGSDGLTVRADAYTYSASPENDSLNALNIDRRVRNQRAGLSMSYPFLLRNRESLTGTAGFYASRNNDTYTSRITGAQVTLSNHLRVVRGELAYAKSGDKQSRRITAGIYKGIDGLGAEQSLNSSYDLDFTRYTLAINQSFALPYEFGVSLAALGQYSSDSLPTSEQITFGGQRFGRGYPAGELGGDKGYGASIELNRRFGVGLPYLHSVTPYVAADYARVSLNDSRYRLVTDTLTSVALGLRITDQRHYAFDVNVAKPVGDKPANSSDRPLRVNANYSLRFE